MSILTVCQNLAPLIGIETPVTVFGSDDQTNQDLKAVARECAEQLAEAFPWQALKVLHTITGDGEETEYDLPDDFGWIPQGQHLRSSSVWGPVYWCTDHDEWLENQIRPFTAVNGMATLLGDQIVFNPARADGEVVKFYYVSNEWAEDSGGSAQNGFTADADTFRLSETMLRKCMTWKWKAYKKLPYADELALFSEDFAKRVMRDRGPRGITVGRRGSVYGGFGSSSSGGDGDISSVFPFTIPFEIS